jgi:hypothetical protein
MKKQLETQLKAKHKQFIIENKLDSDDLDID